MSQEIILNADTRERTGTNKARVIRNVDGMVPAIIYGNEKDSLNIKLKLINQSLPISCLVLSYLAPGLAKPRKQRSNTIQMFLQNSLVLLMTLHQQNHLMHPHHQLLMLLLLQFLALLQPQP